MPVYFIGTPQLRAPQLFAANTRFVKIGLANSVSSRLSNLQTACPLPLELLGVLPGDRQTERALHLRFASDRERGEWFRWSARLEQFIAAECDTSSRRTSGRRPPYEMLRIRARITTAQKALSMSDTELACKVGGCRLAHETVSVYAQALGVSARWLFHGGEVFALSDVNAVPSSSQLKTG